MADPSDHLDRLECVLLDRLHILKTEYEMRAAPIINQIANLRAMRLPRIFVCHHNTAYDFANCPQCLRERTPPSSPPPPEEVVAKENES